MSQNDCLIEYHVKRNEQWVFDAASISQKIIEKGNASENQIYRMRVHVAQGGRCTCIESSQNAEGRVHYEWIQEKESEVAVYVHIRSHHLCQRSYHAHLAGERASIKMHVSHDAIYQADCTMSAHHEGQLTQSHMVYHCSVERESSFSGIAQLGDHASGASAYQRVSHLRMNHQAKVQMQPWLHIHHGDVSCTHGASCLDLDLNWMQYLSSRGIDFEDAKKIVKESFLHAVSPSLDVHGVWHRV